MAEKLQVIINKLEGLLYPDGFECAPFKISWYNDQVDDHFKLKCNQNALAFIIISLPQMFDKTFKTFIMKKYNIDNFPLEDKAEWNEEEKEEFSYNQNVYDPLDQCMLDYFQKIRNHFPDHQLHIIRDFEMDASHRPKVLVQTAGHVAGAVRYYQRCDVHDDPWDESQRIYGTCVHPKYGGWFALRGVIIFEDVNANKLAQVDPPDMIKTDQDRIRLLNLYNFHWRDWSFRDVLPGVVARYSDEQKTFFSTPPSQRPQILRKLFDET
ncbi:uncharacterized protein TRIADDRAFT_29163 [Trichoplax adhaerens]|uniref:Cyanocobalamin reductase (cyanide-eliminating) n=1 Tax=Trichoplax adhaerens TaxID=10228 RepID=B3S4S5_TRIAD|nr:hypothetical protein TRIADDRAFT_29163 [Trichoplax adhaerens]EDV22264.1 hypothetical protein TRIADDRAFT_29163 [Trichoplax adhaerens]|eukprot:XP_002115419.1 hypothetical protein TRIADDRAFT_29163 [Trichoplax adhaerens]